MSRDDGFPIADVDTGYLDDSKVRNLWRALGDQGRMTHALALHVATLLASWGAGCRVTVTEAAPLWLTPDPDLIAALQKTHLLDGTQRLPVRSWKAWHDPASKRREVARERWRRANEKRRKEPNAVAAAVPRGNSAATKATGPSGPVRTGPIGPSSPSRAPARDETPSNDGTTSEFRQKVAQPV